MALHPVKKVLRDASKLLSGRGRWAKGDYAFTKEGLPCDESDVDAYSFCTIGALLCVSGSDDFGDAAIEAVKKAIDKFSLADWNDAPERKKSQVLAALKRAEKYVA